jgi:SAM-dependent methyltransferase
MVRSATHLRRKCAPETANKAKLGDRREGKAMRGNPFSREDWESLWRSPDFSPPWREDGIHELIRTTVEAGFLPKGCTVLDIGCGDGRGAAWVQQAGYQVTGIDFSTAAIELARRSFESPAGPFFEVVDVTQPDRLNRKFEAMIDCGCLHGMGPGMDGYMRNLLAWSRPGTRFVLLVRCDNYPPAVRLQQVRQQFLQWFDLQFCEHKTGCRPRAPRLTHMVFRMIRKADKSLPWSLKVGIDYRLTWGKTPIG